jgi:CRP-like cAMP-binding protein
VELNELLKNIAFFEGIQPQERDAIARIGTLRTYRKGAMIFSEGDAGNEFYVIIKGIVAISKHVAGGRKRNLSTLSAGDIFGELTLFDPGPRSADAEALDDAEIAVFPNEKFRKTLDGAPALVQCIQTRIIRILCKRLRETNDMLKEGVIWGFSIES